MKTDESQSRNSSGDLAAVLEHIADKATPGPWRTGSPNFNCQMDHKHGQGECRYEFRGWMEGEYWDKYIYRDKPMVISGEEELVGGSWGYEEGGIPRREDAELILALRNNLPAILAALRAPLSEQQRFTAVGYVNTLDGCTSTKYEPGRLPDGERMLYIAASPAERPQT